MGETPLITAVIRLLSGVRIDISDEKASQAQIAEAFTAANVTFEREAKLSGRDIPDFLIEPPGLAIEVKLRGTPKMQVFRQLSRYAEHERVTQLLLVTNMSMGLPAEIGGKPAFYLSLGRSWL